ncbi:MAG TPA: carboxymuconolactone decarboxylase family protein [Ramlibacter sp.]|nr:carboxymuconolactone decarboxylase family protein [Ramlibacter sp.]
MPRIPYVVRDTANAEQQVHLDTLEATRGGPVSNIFLALANVPALGEGVLAMATSLRKSTLLSRRLRELAIVTVGIETGATYELLHHWNVALRAGVTQAQLEAMTSYESSALFSTQDRAVIRFALELTRTGKAASPTWDALESLGSDARLELVLTVSWYNCVARMAQSLELDMEEWFPAPSIPKMAFPA